MHFKSLLPKHMTPVCFSVWSVAVFTYVFKYKFFGQIFSFDILNIQCSNKQLVWHACRKADCWDWPGLGPCCCCSVCDRGM